MTSDEPDEEPALFVVLEPPKALGHWIRNCRRKWRGVWRPEIPASLGIIGPVQRPDHMSSAAVAATVNSLSTSLRPIVTNVSELRIFPQHPMVYVEPLQTTKLVQARDVLCQGGLVQAQTPFSAIEHLTVAWFEQGRESEMREALSERSPGGKHRFSSLALYALDERSVTRLLRVELQGRS